MKGPSMRRNIITAVLYTVVTTVLFGVIYPFVVTGLAQLLFHDKANGQLLYKGGQLVGSRIIGQPFSDPQYFHSRPSAAGNGYDAANSGASTNPVIRASAAGASPSHSHPRLITLPKVLIATPSRSGGTTARRSIKPTTDGVRRRPSLIAIGTRSDPELLDLVTSRPSTSKRIPFG